ncbi:hypothetical protein SIIN_2504_T [Serendipita indica DSM 11827]|nr:hypothetical protein SIIN_2504_T [Serendipita indica DSM 11827]
MTGDDNDAEKEPKRERWHRQRAEARNEAKVKEPKFGSPAGETDQPLVCKGSEGGYRGLYGIKEEYGHALGGNGGGGSGTRRGGGKKSEKKNTDLEKKQRRKNKLSERQRGQKKRDLGAWTLAAGRGIE